MKRLLALFLLVVIVGSGLLLWRRSWVEVRPAGSFFTARFPVQPEAASKNLEQGSWNSLKAVQGPVEYGIGWGVFPAAAKVTASPKVFQNMQAAVARECGGKLSAERALHRPLARGMLEGRYVKIDAGKGWAEGYLFLYEGPPARVWQVMVSYPKDGSPPEVEKYLHGFQLVDL
jgi:hypothetical protein